MKDDASAKERPQRPRMQGRPKDDAYVVGRERLIRSTMDLLRTRSPAVVTRTEIAEFAGVDPGLIRYYFGNKDNLLLEVALLLTEERRVRTSEMLARARTTRAKFRAWVEGLIVVMGENPYYSLLMLEQVHRGTSPEARQARHRIVASAFVGLRSIVETGERAGEFRKVDPHFLHLVTIGMCQFFYSRRPMLEELRGGPIPADEMPTVADAYIDFVTDMLMNGLAHPVPASGAQKKRARPSVRKAARRAATPSSRTS